MTEERHRQCWSQMWWMPDYFFQYQLVGPDSQIHWSNSSGKNKHLFLKTCSNTNSVPTWLGLRLMFRNVLALESWSGQEGTFLSRCTWHALSSLFFVEHFFVVTPAGPWGWGGFTPRTIGWLGWMTIHDKALPWALTVISEPYVSFH